MLSLSALFCDDKVRALVRLLQDHPPLAPLERRDTVAAMGTSAVLLQLPEPPLPGNVVASGSALTMQCSCAAGLELGPSHTLALELPSTHAPSARAATKLRIALSPSPAAQAPRRPGDHSHRGAGGCRALAPAVHPRSCARSGAAGEQAAAAAARRRPGARGLGTTLTTHRRRGTHRRARAPPPGGDLAEFFFMVQADERLQMRWFDAAAVRCADAVCTAPPWCQLLPRCEVARRQADLAAAVGAGSLAAGATRRRPQVESASAATQSPSTRARASSVSCSAVVRSARAAQAARTCSRRARRRRALRRETLLAFYRLLWSLGDDRLRRRRAAAAVVWDAPAFAENAWLKVSIRQSAPTRPSRAAADSEGPRLGAAAAAAAFVHHPQLARRRETPPAWRRGPPDRPRPARGGDQSSRRRLPPRLRARG